MWGTRRVFEAAITNVDRKLGVGFRRFLQRERGFGFGFKGKQVIGFGLGDFEQFQVIGGVFGKGKGYGGAEATVAEVEEEAITRRGWRGWEEESD